MLTVAEAAEFLGFNPESVRRAARNGWLPHVRRIGTAYLFSVADVEAYKEKRGRKQRTLPDSTTRA